jgi:predicted nucleotidyltransferase
MNNSFEDKIKSKFELCKVLSNNLQELEDELIDDIVNSKESNTISDWNEIADVVTESVSFEKNFKEFFDKIKELK